MEGEITLVGTTTIELQHYSDLVGQYGANAPAATGESTVHSTLRFEER